MQNPDTSPSSGHSILNMSKKHLLIMVLCCLIPVVGFIALSFLNVPIGGMLFLGLMLLCPISHILLMKYMLGGEGHASHAPAKTGAETKSGRPEPTGPRDI